MRPAPKDVRHRKTVAAATDCSRTREPFPTNGTPQRDGHQLGPAGQHRVPHDRVGGELAGPDEQVATMQQRVRDNPIIEQTARREWAKMCRSIPLAATAGLSRLWIEMRPAFRSSSTIWRCSRDTEP